jgi:sentrin-specific protease 7
MTLCCSDCRYLERRLSAEQKSLFYFFNSFFFTKLLGDSNATTDIDECEVDYKQVQRWTGEVNLFEKDYVFIPILRR